jgi:hypothetical protein
MANLKKKILGNVSGALGDLVFRERNGTNIIAVRPASFNTPSDPASVSRRGRFTMSAKLAGYIASNSKLKSLWNIQKPAGLTVHNHLVKVNYLSVSMVSPGDTVQIVPAGGFPFSANNVDPSSTQFELIISPLGTSTEINISEEVNLQTFSLLFMSEPSGENTTPYAFIPLVSDIKAITLTDPVTFISPMTGTNTLLFNQYTNIKIYFALVTLDASGNIVRYSITEKG